MRDWIFDNKSKNTLKKTQNEPPSSLSNNSGNSSTPKTTMFAMA